MKEYNNGEICVYHHVPNSYSPEKKIVLKKFSIININNINYVTFSK